MTGRHIQQSEILQYNHLNGYWPSKYNLGVLLWAISLWIFELGALETRHLGHQSRVDMTSVFSTKFSMAFNSLQ
jgi:hypothetical protein